VKQAFNIQPQHDKETTMHKSIITALISALIFCLGWGNALAADTPMELKMTVEEEVEVIDAQGNTSLKRTNAENVIPGDTVVYTTRYQYTGKQAADNVAIRNFIPAEVTYLPGSAMGSDSVSFSVDGGNSFDAAGNLTITDGSGETRPATPEDYTHIRWLLPRVESGQTGSVSFKTKVNEE
jgi:uncharacterized repeat protein (TIGR01451 family)